MLHDVVYLVRSACCCLRIICVVEFPINQTLWEIDNDSWLIADELLLARHSHPPAGQPAWSDGKDSFYTISKAPQPAPEAISLPNEDNVQIVYDVGGISAVWRAGEAFIKVHRISHPKATREHVTLRYLWEKGPLDFEIPKVHYHGEFDDVYCIVLGRVPGLTLAEAWPTLSDAEKNDHVHRIANACTALSQWKGDSISGVDGGQLTELYLTTWKAEDNCSPQRLLDNGKEIGMDCTSFVFYHCDLGPGNIIVNGHAIAIIDWEMAGFVPVEWIRTKFRVSGGLNLPGPDQDAQVDWRQRVAQELDKRGYGDVADPWMNWFMSSREQC